MTQTLARAKRKPWVIYLMNNRELGKAVKLLARPNEGGWTMSRRRAAKFRTEEEARFHLAAIEKRPGTSYTVGML